MTGKKKTPLTPLLECDSKIVNDVCGNRPSSKIEKEYASILVYEMLTINDGAVLADSAYKLRQLDVKLKKMGLRATVKVGTAKI